jgi:hypothetical protein
MSDAASGLLTIGLLVVLLAVAYHPVGAWLAKVFTDTSHWRAERVVYRIVRVDPDSEQGWRAYAASVVAFSVAGIVALFAMIVAQTHLPGRQGSAGMGVTTALNTAVSFVTNTNWQSYAGEVGATPLVQTAGLTVQNFVSAAVGLPSLSPWSGRWPVRARSPSATSGSTSSGVSSGYCSPARSSRQCSSSLAASSRTSAPPSPSTAPPASSR